MIGRRAAVVALIVACLAPSAFADQPAFAEGQVWSLSDPEHASTRVRIGRIEDSGRTIHISLWGARTPAPLQSMMGTTLVMQHLPITDQALRASVSMIVTETPPADLGFETGYQIWRDDQGGVFTLTVPEIIEAMVHTIANGQASPTK
ncbi:MAG: hypothetical protein H7124_04690 [Phycisphaerales bacterium]|nr:hypothetical protein [Hyphomonadaceae bacterium]